MNNSKINIIGDIVSDFLERTLGLRFDICRCELCKKKMLDIVLDKFPPYLWEGSKEDSEYQKKFFSLTNQYIKNIMLEIYKAVDYVSNHPPHNLEDDREKSFNQLLEKIYQDRGVDFSQYHRNILKRRIALRMQVNGIDSYTDYLKLLINYPEEYDKLFEVLTINVSEFFRDLDNWAVINSLLKDLSEKARLEKRRLKVWSAGCAYGEEPYSIAILAKELNLAEVIEIIATDVDKSSLEVARRGEFDTYRIKNISKELLKKYFDSKGDGKYQLKDNIKIMVEFKYHNLIGDPYPKDMDIIFCRNVFIYFTKPLQEQILNRFYYSLRDEGYLVIGKSEVILTEAKLIFEEVSIENRLYRKKI
ncbi:MAG: protein-glutamate O-methyltransferase CheR [Candidatus Omnitrophica bacterium]|nr:protein-glutamate O-methyltransferase CheR [Candidatus Omnitrophota bacterium]